VNAYVLVSAICSFMTALGQVYNYGLMSNIGVYSYSMYGGWSMYVFCWQLELLLCFMN